MRGTVVLAIIVVSAASGCASGFKPYQPIDHTKRTIFMPSVRAVGPEPVYARTRWVYASEALPNREREADVESVSLRGSPRLRAVFHLSLKNSTLEETARVLAATARYSSYTAPSIASEKISVDNLGTIDELAQIISSKAHVEVIVDHQNKEVRFLAARGEQPRLFEE